MLICSVLNINRTRIRLIFGRSNMNSTVFESSDLWKSLPQLTPQPFASPQKRASTPATVSTSAQNAIQAKQRLASAKKTSNFWQNRLALLKREVERAQLDLDRTRTRGNAAEVAIVLSESVSAQLELERQRIAHLQAEKREAIRIQTLEHKVAARQAHQRILREKMSAGMEHRAISKSLQSELQSRKIEDVHKKAAQRASVQLDKVHAMVSRVRVNAMRREEARLAFEANVDAVERDASQLELLSSAAVVEASSLVDRIRALKALAISADASRGAQRSLASTMYQDAS